MTIRVGTRRSALAKTQTDWVVKKLQGLGIVCETVEITSDGDQEQSQPLYSIESSAPGLFTKRLEQALLNREIDLAVHSLKDLPTLQPPELVVAAIPPRELAQDVLVCRTSAVDTASPWGIRPGSTVGTSSLRREALLLSQAQVSVVPLRGNVPTRIAAVEKGSLDGAVLAHAGIRRLGMTLNPSLKLLPLDESAFVSAPGQGALALEVRRDLPENILKQIRSLQDFVTAEETRWERHVLRQLEGGCTLPLGVRCIFHKPLWEMHVFLGLGEVGSFGAVSRKNKWREFHRRSWSGDKIDLLVGEAVSHFSSIMGK